MSVRYFILASLFAVFAKTFGLENDLIIETKSGKVQGETRNSSNGREYYSFTGIPFAKPPIGELRFEPPEPADPWDGILNATKNVQCPQFDFFSNSSMFTGDEDCLVLNVYTPKLPEQNSTRKLPVMVFVHGGGFVLGTGQENFYGANLLMNRDIVLVTFNYRLDALGFLSTGDDVLPGNYGMLDQVAALKWVQSNIEKFGGDPNKVTIFGESAGGASVTHLYLSPKTKGLFHAAIAQSGASVCDYALQEKPRQNARRLAAKFNCPTHPSNEIKNCLKNKTAFEILTKAKEFMTISLFPIVFSPVVEKTESGFFPDSPENLLKHNNSNKVPIIIGINEKEGLGTYFVMDNYTGVRGEEFLKDEMPDLISFFSVGAKSKGKEIVDEYFKGLDANDNITFRDTMISVYSDSFTACVMRMVKLLVENDHPVFVYRFIHHGNKTWFGNRAEYLGVDHGDELMYLFYSKLFGELSGINVKMSDIMLDLWTNFATIHNPTSNNLDKQSNVKWLPSEKNNLQYLELDLDPVMISGEPMNRTDFWLSMENDN